VCLILIKFQVVQKYFFYLYKMKIKVLAIGKTDDKNLIQLIDTYQNRLKHYIKFELTLIPDIKNVKNLSDIFSHL